MLPKSQLGILTVATAASLWGLQGILSKFIYRSGMDPLSLATCKVGISFVALALVLLIRSPQHIKLNRQHLPSLMAYGILGVGLFNISLLTAMHFTTITTAVTLLYTAPAFVAILSAVFLGENLTKTKLLALVSTLAGCYLVIGGYTVNWTEVNATGIGAGLTAGFTYALYSVIGKKKVSEVNRWTVMFYGLGFGTLLLLIVRPPFNIGNYSVSTWFYIIFLALGTTLAYTLYIKGLTLLEASKASIIASLEPVVAVFLAVLVLHESLSLPKVIGFFLVIFAVLLLIQEKEPKREITTGND